MGEESRRIYIPSIVKAYLKYQSESARPVIGELYLTAP